MTARKLLTRVIELGIVLWPDGERLLYQPVNAVDQKLLADLRAHKSELLDLLGKPVQTPAGRGRLVAELPERAVVALEQQPGRFEVFLPGEVGPPGTIMNDETLRSTVH